MTEKVERSAGTIIGGKSGVSYHVERWLERFLKIEPKCLFQNKKRQNEKWNANVREKRERFSRSVLFPYLGVRG